MKEKPILCRGHEVKAILEGRKTQMRMIVKDIILPYHNGFILESTDKKKKRNDAIFSNSIDAKTATIYQYARPPYMVGDRLWVRETFGIPEFIEPKCVSNESVGSEWTPEYTMIKYRADGSTMVIHDELEDHEQRVASSCYRKKMWRPSSNMPRWASRITLEITNIRVERLQDITDEDAQAEGIFFTDYGKTCFHPRPCPLPNNHEHHLQKPGWSHEKSTGDSECIGSPRFAFARLWNSINADRAPWESNQWVWVIEFKTV